MPPPPPHPLPDLNTGVDLREALGAVLFGQAAVYTLDAWGTLHSSPWTAETFGVDPKKADRTRKYVRKAIGVSLVLALISSYSSHSAWPIIGTVGMNAYLWWTYEQAIAYAQTNAGQPTGSWENPTG